MPQRNPITKEPDKLITSVLIGNIPLENLYSIPPTRYRNNAPTIPPNAIIKNLNINQCSLISQELSAHIEALNGELHRLLDHHNVVDIYKNYGEGGI